AKLLYRARPADRAVTHIRCRLLVALDISIVHGILEHRRHPAIIFRRHEDIAVECGDLLLPALSHLVLGRYPGVRCYFVEKRHWKIPQVDDFRHHIPALRGNILNPLCRLVPEAGRTSGADDDGDLRLGHFDSLVSNYRPCSTRANRVTI